MLHNIGNTELPFAPIPGRVSASRNTNTRASSKQRYCICCDDSGTARCNKETTTHRYIKAAKLTPLAILTETIKRTTRARRRGPGACVVDALTAAT